MLDGDSARGALTVLIQFQLTADELERRGASVTSEDHSTVEQTYGDQLKSMKPRSAAIASKGLLEQAALSRVLKQIDPSSKAEQAELYARATSYRRVRCFEGLVAPNTGEAAIGEALQAGSSIADIIAKGVGGATAGLGEGEQCYPPNAKPNLPANVSKLIFDAKPGAVGAVEAPDNQGNPLAVVVHVTRDRTVGPDDPYIGQLLQSVQQGGIEAWLPLVMESADVKVNPEYGRGFTATTGVIAPVSPRPPSGSRTPATSAQPAA